MPRLPRKASNSAVSVGLPRRQHPTADSLSQTSSRGTAPMFCSSCQCPAIRSGACRDAIITAHRIRE
jgi:hypothetical protein